MNTVDQPSIDYTDQYFYDLVGNRLEEVQQTAAGTTVTRSTYDANDRLLQSVAETGGDPTTDVTMVYQYGANATSTYGGDATCQTSGIVYNASGVRTSKTDYNYNLEGMTSSASVKQFGTDGSTITSETDCTYSYDDSGIRVSQTVNGQETVYLNDNNNPTGYSQVLEEKDASGNLLRSYALGLNIIAQAKASGPVYYFGDDGQGSTRMLLDSSGSIVVVIVTGRGRQRPPPSPKSSPTTPTATRSASTRAPRLDVDPLRRPTD